MANHAYIVAITGGIGSGKTEASNIFAAFGVPIIDLDVISHQLTAKDSKLLPEISRTFGTNYVTEDNTLDRNKMRQLVFEDDSAREKLHQILHPAIYEEALAQIAQLNEDAYAILSIPLLEPDSQYLKDIDRILVIDCNETTQISRVRARSKLSETEIKKIIAKQIPRKIRLAMADDIVENNGNIEQLQQNLMNLHQKYMKTCIVRKRIS